MSPGVVHLSVPASASSFQSLIVKHETLHKEEPGNPCPAAPRDVFPSFQMMLIFPITFQSNIVHCVINIIKKRYSQTSVSFSTKKSTFAQSVRWFGQFSSQQSLSESKSCCCVCLIFFEELKKTCSSFIFLHIHAEMHPLPKEG